MSLHDDWAASRADLRRNLKLLRAEMHQLVINVATLKRLSVRLMSIVDESNSIDASIASLESEASSYAAILDEESILIYGKMNGWDEK